MVFDKIMEPVGTHQKEVAGLQRDGSFRSFREEGIAHPQSGGEDAALRMFGGFGRGELALLEKAVHDGVVLRELREGRIAEQVETRIADVNVVELGASKNRGDAGGAHAFEFGMLLSTVTNGEVRSMQGLGEGLLRRVRVSGKIGGAHRLDSDAAGNLTTAMAAHAVGNHGQAALARKVSLAVWFGVAVVVLIVRALAADIGKIAEFNSSADLLAGVLYNGLGKGHGGTIHAGHGVTGT